MLIFLPFLLHPARTRASGVSVRRARPNGYTMLPVVIMMVGENRNMSMSVRSLWEARPVPISTRAETPTKAIVDYTNTPPVGDEIKAEQPKARPMS